MSLQQKLSGITFTDTGLPTVYIDPVLAKAGALLLVDPTHPYSPWASGVPGNGGKVTNLARLQAAALASDTAANCDADIAYAGLTGTDGLVERTSKGGLHGLVRQATAPTTGMYAQARIPTPIVNYLIANPSHTYYWSLWHRITRAVPAGSTGLKQPFALVAQDNAKNFMVMQSEGDQPANGQARRLGGVVTNAAAVGPSFRAVAENAPSAAITTLAAYNADVWNVGINNSWRIGGGTFPPSHVLYRAYIEDLTVSGRSYAQVAALDQAEYTAQVLTTGGRYYGDTFSDPTAAAP